MIFYKENYKLKESDFDFNDNMRASAYLDIFQTVAAKHATMLGMGFEEMKQKNIAWVVTKIKFDCFVKLYPGMTITAETYPHPKGIVDYTRDFYLYDENGTLAAKGTSQWVHIDFKERKIVKPSVDFDGQFTDKYAYDNKRIERILPLKSAPVYSHTIQRSELDHNGHTNNIKYTDIAFNSFDLPARPLKKVIVNFLAETKLNEIVDVSVEKQNDNLYVFSGSKNGESCFTALYEYFD